MTDITWQQVAGAYAKRYQAVRRMAWLPGPHVQALIEIAEWINLQEADSKEVGTRLLDNWFDTRWAMKVDYKPKFLTENLGAVYNPPAVPLEEEPSPEAINAQRVRARRAEEEKELDAKLRGNQEGAVPPPGSVEEMIAGIGRDMK